MDSSHDTSVSLSNRLLTAIPEELLRKCDDIRSLNLSGNPGIQLQNSLKHFKHLRMITLSECKLRAIPDDIWELTELEDLNLDESDFSSGLGGEIGKLVRLRKLSLVKCQLRSLPRAIGNLKKLEQLNLCGNKFSAGLCDEIGKLVRLKRLNVADCHLTALPKTIGHIVQLEYLSLGWNIFSAGLCDEIGKLVRLKILKLPHCELTALPKTIGNLKKLEDLDLYRNNFSAGLRVEIGKLVRLKKLKLSFCELTALPKTIGNLVQALLAAAFAVSEAAELLLVPISLPVATAAHANCSDCRLLPMLASTAVAAVVEAPRYAATTTAYQKLLEALAMLANGGLPRQAAFLEFALFGACSSDRAARQTAAEEQLDGSATNRDAVHSRLLLDGDTCMEHSDFHLDGLRRSWRLCSLAEVAYCRQASKLLTGAIVSQDRDPSRAERALACLKLIEQLTATATTVVDSAATAKRRAAASAADESAGAATRSFDMAAAARLADTPCGCAAAEHSAEVVGKLLLDNHVFAEDIAPASCGAGSSSSTEQPISTALPAQPSVCGTRDAVAAASDDVPAASAAAAVSAVGPAEQSFDSHSSSSSSAGKLVSEELPRRLVPSIFLPAVKLAWCCCLEAMCAQSSDVQPPCPLAVASRLLDRASSAAATAATAVHCGRFAEATTRMAMLDAVRGLLNAQQRVTT